MLVKTYKKKNFTTLSENVLALNIKNKHITEKYVFIINLHKIKIIYCFNECINK